MPWRPEGRDEAVRALVRRLIATRRASPALSRGDIAWWRAEGQLLVYRRAAGADVALVAINAGAEPVTIDLGSGAPEGWVPVVSAGNATTSGPSLALGPLSGAVLRPTA